MDAFHRSKGDFPITCAVTSFKIRIHYVVGNLTLEFIPLKIITQAGPLNGNSPWRGEGASQQEVSTRVRQREELN